MVVLEHRGDEPLVCVSAVTPAFRVTERYTARKGPADTRPTAPAGMRRFFDAVAGPQESEAILRLSQANGWRFD